ncbi:MAG TPA: MFS transporter [Streptosporangiaceae bacterium]|nr:MFS transporter [Streptosporangiaceae bacterium]
MPDQPSSRLRRPAIAAVFVLLGGAEGTWAARIPAIKAGLHLSPGLLGLALLGPALGCVLAMPAIGAILASMAPRRVVRVGLVAVAGFLPLTTLATSTWQLFIVLTGWGAGIGIVDVGMNTEAAAVQDQLGRRVMSGFHGAYSIGGLAGAGLGAVAAATGVSARTTFIIAGATIAVVGLCSAQAFAARPTHHGAGHLSPRSRWPKWSWALLALGAMSFASFLGEGSASNWSAVYLHSSLGASPALAAVGFTVFSCAMTAGRLSGDWLADRLGPVRLVRLSATVAGAGFGGALLVGQVWSGLAGFALLGGGLSVVVPLAFTAAARLGRPGPNLAFATSAGYLGSLAGPPLIGGLAEVTSLPAALGVVAVLCAMIVLLAGTIRPRTAAAPPAAPPTPLAPPAPQASSPTCPD